MELAIQASLSTGGTDKNASRLSGRSDVHLPEFQKGCVGGNGKYVANRLHFVAIC